jgi:hypothetical protein
VFTNVAGSATTTAATLTVAKATPTATLNVTNTPQTYTCVGQSATVSVDTSSVPGTVANISTGGAATQTNASTYGVTADFVPNDTANYNTLVGLSAGNFVITPATATVDIVDYSGVYDANPHTVSVTITGVGGAPLAYEELTGTNVLESGSVTASTSDPNYEPASGTAYLTIDQATLSVDVTGYFGGTYDSEEHTQTVTVTGVGSDGELFTESLSATSAGYHSEAWSYSNSNYFDVAGVLEFTIDQRQATWTTSNNSKTFGSLDPVPLTTGSPSNFVDTVTATYSRVSGESVVGSPYHITATLNADPGVLDNYIITNTGAEFTINVAPTVAALTLSPSSVQYSDQSTFTVTISPDQIMGVAPATGVQFKVNDVNYGAVQTLTDAGSYLTASLTTQILRAPGSYTVTANFVGINPNFEVNNPSSQSLTVTEEDARAYYTGLYLVPTASPTSTSFTMTLSATIRDITAVVGDPSYDAYAGDIRNARVSFIIRGATNTTIASDLVPTLPNAMDPTLGTVSYTWNSIITGDAQTFVIGIVNDHYTRNSTSDDVAVTVAKPRRRDAFGRQ